MLYITRTLFVSLVTLAPCTIQLLIDEWEGEEVVLVPDFPVAFSSQYYIFKGCYI